VGSYVLNVNGESIIYTHSGLRPAYLEYLKSKIGSVDAKSIAAYVNSKLYDAVKRCKHYRCIFDEETFEAGEDRGGSRTCVALLCIVLISYSKISEDHFGLTSASLKKPHKSNNMKQPISFKVLRHWNFECYAAKFSPAISRWAYDGILL
jgi:hypothetical protein